MWGTQKPGVNEKGMKMKRVAGFLASVAVGLAFVPQLIGMTLYVDDDNYVPDFTTYQQYEAAGFDGTTEAKAFGTIQMAVDKIPAGDSATSPNEIVVLPGTYDKGLVEAGNNISLTRVYVNSKNYIRIRSRDGAAATHIVGAKDASTLTTDGYWGCGDAAAHGVANYRSAGLRLEGFTIRDCAARYGDGAEHGYSCGAAVYTSSTDYQTFVADSVISNCVSRYGVVYRGAFFRTLFAYNLSVSCGVARQTDLYCCALAHNIDRGANNRILVNAGAHAVNCTVIDNGVGNAFNGCTVYNTVVASSAAGAPYEIVSSVAAAGNVTTQSAGAYQVVAPIFNDFRVIKGAAAESAGDASQLDASSFFARNSAFFPTEWLYYDYDRKEIAKTGSVMAGCVQKTATPAGGRIEFSGLTATRRLRLDGALVCHDGAYAYPTTYPVQWRLSSELLGSGEELYGWDYSDTEGKTGDEGRYLFPQMDGTAVITPPADVSLSVTRTLRVADAILWADPKADLATQDGTVDHPYRRLCDLGEAVSGKTAVICKLKPGTYDEGLTYHWGSTNRFTIRGGNTYCRFVGVEGAANTIVKGAPDPTVTTGNHRGCGAAAIRGFTSLSRSSAQQMQGITFADCHSGGDTADGKHGSVCYLGSAATILLDDCIITNCGSHGDLINSAVMHRTKVLDCHPCERVAWNGGTTKHMYAFACYFENVRGLQNHAFGAMDLVQCTVVDTTASGSYRGVSSDSPVVNCALSGGFDFKSTKSAGNAVCNYSSVTAPRGYAEGDILLVAAGSPKLFSRTSARTAGVAPTMENLAMTYHWFPGADINGNKLLVEDGKFAAGADQAFVANGVYAKSSAGGIAVVGGTDGYNAIPAGGSVAVEIRAAARPCAGFTANGVTNLFGDATSVAITEAAATADGGYLLEPIFTSDWHVSPNGNDKALGYTPSTAFKTLTNAMAHAISGDTVHAGAGVYREGSAVHDPSATIRSRVVVKAGVTLVADEGAAKTVIEGEIDNETPDAEAAPAQAAYGCGPKGMRGVFLSSGAKISGFTIRGCRTRGTVTGNHHYDYDYAGGGICGVWNSFASCLVENCVLSNNAAYRGGAARNVSMSKCILSDNVGFFNSPALGEGVLYGCVVRNHSGGGAATYGVNKICDTTFSGCRSLSGTAANPWDLTNLKTDGTGSAVRNVAVLGTVVCYPAENGALSNVFATAANGTAGHPGVTVVTEAQLALDPATLRPDARTSVLVDAADTAYDVSGFDYTTDASGFQRVMNAARDVGALEGDWRDIYAKDIGNRSVEVAEASPAVTEDDGTKSVLVPAGSSLSVLLHAGMKADYSFRFKVPEGGLLVLSEDGVETAYSEGLHEVAFSAKEIDKSLVFTSTAGTSELLKGRSRSGILFLVQ